MNEVSTVPAAASAAPADRASANPLDWLRGEIDRLFDDFNFGRPTCSIFNFPTPLDTLRPAADLVDEGGS